MEERSGLLRMDRHLTLEEKSRIIGIYEERLSRLGLSVQTVGWGSKDSQVLRFQVLCRNINLSGKRVLDVGCGLGDFVPYLDAAGFADVSYTGIDISAKLVAEARRLHGKDGRLFVAGDLLADDMDLGRFDFVVCSGALSLRIADNVGLARAMIRKMYSICDGAVAVNFLSTYVDYQLEKDFHYGPEAMFSISRQIARRVNLYHDYPLYEFTIQLFRDPEIMGS
jgi:SAM-dependent methyltransferase